MVTSAVLLVETEFVSGSGFLLSADGRAATAARVTDGLDWVQVTLADGTQYDAKVIRENRILDIAILQLKGARPAGGEFPFLNLDQVTPRLGADVGILGYPLESVFDTGFTTGSMTVNRGVVSSIRKESVTVEVIQTDAAVNAGISGGPMVDPNGNVLGLITSEVVRDGVEGFGFAVASQHIAAVLELTRPGSQSNPAAIVKTGFCPAGDPARNQTFTVPAIPNLVSGSVFVLGNPAPDGLEIVARLQPDSLLGECWTDAARTAEGKYSLLIAYPDSRDIWFPVEIYVVGVKVAEIPKDRPEYQVSLDIYLPPDSAPTPTPTPTPTPVPTPTVAVPTPTPSPGPPGTASVLIDWPSSIVVVASEVLQSDGTWLAAAGVLTTEPAADGFPVYRLTASAPSTLYFGLRMKLQRPGIDPTQWIEILRPFQIFPGSRSNIQTTLSTAELSAAGL
ncbi:MAG: trypsin-like peptidase domain-containing protein [Chloroflexi bacterium]|nr:trypsin-like peptidase domain-containing protein [Chloroflexota bacterium]